MGSGAKEPSPSKCSGIPVFTSGNLSAAKLVLTQFSAGKRKPFSPKPEKASCEHSAVLITATGGSAFSLMCAVPAAWSSRADLFLPS